MGNEQIANLLKAAGITAGVITFGLGLGLALTAYKNYYEVRKCKLEIKVLKEKLNIR